MNDSKIKFPDYVKTKKDKVIHRFLSNLADHHGKNVFWIRSQFPHYQRKFKNIPEKYLVTAFQDYLTDVMPSWLPTLPQVAEVIYDRKDFQIHWHTIDLDMYYCIHCKTDSIGKEGGMRSLHYYGFIPSKNKIGEYECVANCDCELGRKNTRSPLSATIDWLQSHDENAEIHVSYFNAQTGRIVTAKEQSSITWEHKIKDGILRRAIPNSKENPDHLYPCWEHPIWGGVFGKELCDRFGFEMPDEIKEQYLQRPRLDKKRQFEKQVQLRRTIAKDPNAPLSAPKSLADLVPDNPSLLSLLPKDSMGGR